MEKKFFSSLAVMHIVATLFAGFLLFSYDYFRNDLPNFFEYWLGGSLYIMFWIFLTCAFLSSRFRLISISIFVTFTTCIIEFSQLWKPTWLEIIRSYKLGYALFGTTFNWTDFPPYFVGGFLGFFISASIERLFLGVLCKKVNSAN